MPGQIPDTLQEPSRAPASAPGYNALTAALVPHREAPPSADTPETAPHAFNSQAEPTGAAGERHSKRRLRPAAAYCAISSLLQGFWGCRSLNPKILTSWRSPWR